MSVLVQKVIHVADRTWEAMRAGAVFERWPGEATPEEDERVVLFDRDLEFTQHDVTHVDGLRVTVGPAIPWH
jgi:hypothetical protein